MTQNHKIKPGSPGKGARRQTSIKDRSTILLFATRLAGKHRRPLVTNTLPLLNHIIGKQLSGMGRLGFDGSMVYREPGRALHQSFYTWLVESVLSLTVNKLKQSFEIWVNQAYTAQTLSNLENRIHFVVQPQIQAVRMQAEPQKVFLNQPARMMSTSLESHEVLRNVKSVLQTASTKDMSSHHTLLQARDVLYTVERSLQAIYASQTGEQHKQNFYLPSFQTIQPLLTNYAAMRASEIRRESDIYATNNSASQSSVLVARQQKQDAAIRAGESRYEFRMPFINIPASRSSVLVAQQQKHNSTVRDGEIRREFGIPVLNISTSQSRVLVAQQQKQDAKSKHFDSTQPHNRSWKEYIRSTTQDSYRTTSLELMSLAFSARDLAEKIEERYITNPLVGLAVTSRMAYVYEGVSGDGHRFPTAEFVSRSPGMKSDVAMRTSTSLHHRSSLHHPSLYRSSLYHLKSPAGRMRSDQLGPYKRYLHEQYRHEQYRQAGREIVSRWPVALTKIEKWLEQKKDSHFSLTSVKTSSGRPADRFLLNARRSGESGHHHENSFALLLNRELIARTTQAYNIITEDQQNRVFNKYSFLRREEQMRPPMQSYAFAQPVHPTLVDEHEVKRVQEKAVVEIVRKEVETLMKSKSPMTELSRFDYSRITDQVWFSLSRRLMMEKERLGHRY
jgi:hypothetical protein